MAASFDGSAITSTVGALLFGATDRVINLIGRFAARFQGVCTRADRLRY